jgi:3-phenylpropionate/cinnamic acid dioxygenase small subunit
LTAAIEPADELAIRALLIRYATAIDTKDWQLFRACFTDDCKARYGGLAWHGADVLTAAFDEAHAPLDDSLHCVLNITVLAHDRDTAATRSYCDAVLVRRGAAGGSVLEVYGIYLDALLREHGSWRIADRHFRAISYNGSLGVMGLDPEQVAIGYGDAVRGV